MSTQIQATELVLDPCRQGANRSFLRLSFGDQARMHSLDKQLNGTSAHRDARNS